MVIVLKALLIWSSVKAFLLLSRALWCVFFWSEYHRLDILIAHV
nr:MAG TPA: hypothetical protein [Caudoviricetes sp.]